MANSTGTSGRNIRWGSSVTSPLKGITRALYPTNIADVLSWAQELWLHHGVYSQAITKAVRYFMTEVEIYGKDINYNTRKNYKEILNAKYDLLSELACIGDEFIAFGNSFTSIYIPFNRTLFCPRCGFHAPIKQLKDIYKWNNFEFIMKCPKEGCNYTGKFIHKDTKATETELNPVIVRWPPQLIAIEKHPITQHSTYYLNVMQYTEVVEAVSNGVPKYLEETPWELIQAIKEKQMLEFQDGELYHMFTPVPAYTTTELMGWGLPKFMAEFEDVVMLSLLDKYNEVILSDYLVPMRTLSPARTTGPQMNGGADPMLNVSMSGFVAKTKAMIDRHRINPTDWNITPFPLEYQILGGEAKNLAPIDIMEHMESRLLNSMGIPQEMYAGSINNSAGPIIGFKMFERTWQHFASELDKWLNWFVSKNGELFQWEEVSARLVPVSIQEDPEVRGMKFELAASKQCSKDTAFRSIGLDAAYEQQRVWEEEEEYNEQTALRQIEQEKKDIAGQAMRVPPPGEDILMAEQQAAEAKAGGQAPAQGGGAPPASTPMTGGGPTGSASMDELYARADQLAQEILVMPSSQRVSTLLDLGKQDEALHSLVKEKLAKLERDAGQQGKNMARQGQM